MLKAVSNIAFASTDIAITNNTSTNAVYYPTFVAGTSGNQVVNVSSTGLTFNPSGPFLGIGSTAPDSPLTINSNITAAPAAIAGTAFHYIAADAANGKFLSDAFGNNNTLAFRRADGTNASPTAVQTNEVIGAVTAYGYGATGYSNGARAQISLAAGENWTDTAQGSILFFSNTTLGTTTINISARLSSRGLGFGLSPAASVHIASAQSATAWTTNGIALRQDSVTYTDTTSTGTVALTAINSLAGGAIAATSSTTYTIAATLYVPGGPTQGSNVAISSPYAIYTPSSAVNRFAGNNSFGSVVTPLSFVNIAGTVSSASWTTTGTSFAVNAGTATDTTGSGAIGTRVINSFAAVALAANSSETISVGATVYIAGAPTNGTNVTITNPYSLYIPNGNTRLDGFNGFGGLNPNAVVSIGAAQSQPSWTTIGLLFNVNASILTDTTGTGSIVQPRVANSFGISTFASTSSVTLTTAATVYIGGSPLAGTNTTISAAYALYIATGNAILNNGGLSINGVISSGATLTSVGGSTSGTATFTQPFTGGSYKKTVIFLNALLGTASYTFPAAFTNTPVILTTNGLAAAIATSLSTSSVTVTGTTTTGVLIIEGY